MIRLSVGHDKTVYPWHGGGAWHGCHTLGARVRQGSLTLGSRV